MTTAILAVLDVQSKRLRRARLRLRAAERARRIGDYYAVRRALIPLYEVGDSLDAFDRNLIANEHADNMAFRAFSRARQYVAESDRILKGGAL
jgi:hypothetical protein